jgi:hypothetical protein
MSSTDSNFQGYGAAASHWSIINSFFFQITFNSNGYILPAVIKSVDNVNLGVTDISDAISEQQRQLDCESERQANI